MAFALVKEKITIAVGGGGQEVTQVQSCTLNVSVFQWSNFLHKSINMGSVFSKEISIDMDSFFCLKSNLMQTHEIKKEYCISREIPKMGTFFCQNIFLMCLGVFSGDMPVQTKHESSSSTLFDQSCSKLNHF